MADAHAAKFSGAWLLEVIDGDITPWMYYEGYGFTARQMAWATGYGAGSVSLEVVIHEGKLYTQKYSDKYQTFRGVVKLDGSRQPALFSEGAPAAELRNGEVEATFEDGVIKGTFYRADGSMHNKFQRIISEDGQKMIATVTFPAGDHGGEAGGECVMTATYTKKEEAKVTVDVVKGWFQGTSLVADATEEAGVATTKAVTTSLEGLFSSPQEMMSLWEQINRSIPPTATLTEQSATEFTVTDQRESGKWVFEQKWDKEACTFDVTSTKDGTCFGTWHYKALSDPLRLQCWNTSGTDFESICSSIKEVEKAMDKILAGKK